MDYQETGVQRYELSHKDGDRYYVDEARWMSYYHQMRLLLGAGNVRNILEIGPGNNFMQRMLSDYFKEYHTYDIDPKSSPTYLGLENLNKVAKESYDICCAFQVLEHMEFDEALGFIELMSSITKNQMIISLPVAIPTWRIFFSIPRFKGKKIIMDNFLVKSKHMSFDGIHHRELGNKNVSIQDFEKILSKYGTVESFRNFYNPYHHFFTCSLS